jgi:hypothetical protein
VAVLGEEERAERPSDDGAPAKARDGQARRKAAAVGEPAGGKGEHTSASDTHHHHLTGISSCAHSSSCQHDRHQQVPAAASKALLVVRGDREGTHHFMRVDTGEM